MNRHLSRRIDRAPSQPADTVGVDVTPVMNLFIILIPFLVSMAVFSHLAIQAFRLPAGEGAGQAQQADDLPWTVAVTAEAIAVARGDWILGEAARTNADYDYPALGDLLQKARRSRPDLDRVVVAVDDGVICADVVGCLDRCRDAGFVDVGLAEGTGLAGRDDR